MNLIRIAINLACAYGAFSAASAAYAVGFGGADPNTIDPLMWVCIVGLLGFYCIGYIGSVVESLVSK